MSDFPRHKAVAVDEPQGEGLPLIFDSPHSGTLYTDDFTHAVDPFLLRGGEDRFVDDLIAEAPRHGITVIRALFARTYIDPNRDRGDLDPEILQEDWPEPVRPGVHSARGVGLIFRLIGDAVPIYDRRLPPAEVHHRIETYWMRYHACLDRRVERLHARHGATWHVDWHSMQSVGNALSPDPGAVRPDFVLGDLHGRSCDAAFTRQAAHILKELGYGVAINEPYAGAYIVERHGRPAQNRHSLQIEINRGLYMDQERLVATDGLPKLREALGTFGRHLAHWVRGALRDPA